MIKEKESENPKQLDSLYYKHKKVKYIMQNLVYVAAAILIGAIMLSGLILFVKVIKYSW